MQSCKTKLKLLLLHEEGTEVKFSDSGKNRITTCKVITLPRKVLPTDNQSGAKASEMN